MFRFGVDYYPEHWPPERWPEDARHMRAAGFNTVRLAEFAWSRLESAVYAGAFGDGALYEHLAPWLLAEAGITPGPATPDGVEVCTRWQGDQRLVFVLNHTAEEQTVVLPGGYTPLLGDEQTPAETATGSAETTGTTQFTIPPREVIVLLGEEAYNPSARISVAHA